MILFPVFRRTQELITTVYGQRRDAFDASIQVCSEAPRVILASGNNEGFVADYRTSSSESFGIFGLNISHYRAW